MSNYIVLCLFCSQQLGDNAFMSCEPQFFGHIKVIYYSSFLALIWNFCHVLTKIIINHNLFNNNYWDRAYFPSVMTKQKADVSPKKGWYYFHWKSCTKMSLNTIIYIFDWASASSLSLLPQPLAAVSGLWFQLQLLASAFSLRPLPQYLASAFCFSL